MAQLNNVSDHILIIEQNSLHPSTDNCFLFSSHTERACVFLVSYANKEPSFYLVFNLTKDAWYKPITTTIMSSLVARIPFKRNL